MIDKPSEKEEEYFARQNFERKKKEEEQARREMEEAERQRLKELHYMRCPKCGMELLELDYRGLKIDKCPTCEGIWLDAGELDSILEESGGRLGGFLRIFSK
ncbi:MAG: zf-TFIIB domain-containing protein [Candidatus Nitrospinota bacterium M3_3B_026]